MQPVVKTRERVINTLNGRANDIQKKTKEQSFKDECYNQFYPFDLKHVAGTLCLELSLDQRGRVAISCVAEN
jgi:hypothetical protein